jgi:hypothetical protein
MRAPLDLTRAHRQQGLRPIQRLDLTFLVDAQNPRALGRRQIEPGNIAHFFDEQRIGGQLERLGAMRL